MAAVFSIHAHGPRRDLPFPETPHTPAEHFRIAYYAAVSVVWEQVASACGSEQAALIEFPFLGKYVDCLSAFAGRKSGLSDWWLDAVREWERHATVRLPIVSLRRSIDLDPPALAFLMTVGLVEEDPSFGVLFEVAQARPGLRRPTAGLLHAWWRNAFPELDSRAMARALLETGLLRRVDAGSVNADHAYEVPAPVWAAMRGEAATRPIPGVTFVPADTLPDLADVILPRQVYDQVASLEPLLVSGDIQAVAVRGPSRNGRETVLRALAKRVGRAALVVDQAAAGDPDRAYMLGPLATLSAAMPIVRYDLFAGERAPLPEMRGYDGPVGIVIGAHGGLEGERLSRLFTIDLDLPDAELRAMHWAQAQGGGSAIDIGVAARRLRLTSGNIRRVAALAPGYAAIAGREAVTGDDLRKASGALNRQALDALATLLPPAPELGYLAVGEETRTELEHLLRRCRHRDELGNVVGTAFESQASHGVRALFTGPSGTGKTFAARLLATELGIDLYRIDLAAVVDKYIGETEKHLGQLFAHAEELDVMLLLDEGDALLGERSAVHSATDRYANLETNYLLQRLETFDGILIVTTNAGDRIDRAFERRMDVVVTFQMPETRERAAIWRSHLPEGRDVSECAIDHIAHAYRLSGGQIRNAALHAGLLALDDGGRVTATHLDAAIQREYRKLGRIAPKLDDGDIQGATRDG